MTPELYQRLKPLYAAALDLTKEQRSQFVHGACRDDPELQENLEALLSAHDESTGPLDAPLVNLRSLYPENQRTLTDGELVLGRFKIVRLIGWGGMGEVYEAEDHFLRGVNVALKTILPQVASDPDRRKRFEREVLLAREVTHPNLCPIHTIFHCDDPPPGFLFLSMKLLPGKTLATRLREPPPMTHEEGLAVLRQTSLGISAIHAAGIIHRDIKPNNIMVDGSGPDLHLWITDFGLARAYENESTLSAQGTITGTPGYMAPELFLGHPPSQASDLFALGVVLHEVFTGQKPTPVPGTHSYSISSQLATPIVPALSVRLVTECLQDDPRRRCAAFAETLEVFDSRLDRSHYTGSSSQFWTRRRFATTAVASVCALAGGTWWKWDELGNALHPLPPKRFVALLSWPESSDSRVAPMLAGALSAIKNELSRFESVDRDLFVISPEDVGTQFAETKQLKEICDSLGANLVLAASGFSVSSHFKVLLRLLDPVTGHSLRERTLEISLGAITSLPQRAVEAASALLNLRHSLAGGAFAGPGTQSSAAFTAFQSAELLMNQSNDAGLDAAIAKYKNAVELDSHFALAHAKLALAYCRLAPVRHDAGALDLARGNAQLSMRINPNLVEGHLAMSSVLEQTGQEEDALREISRALSLDPSDPRTLVWQAQIYSRLNRWSESERTFKRVLIDRPNYWLAYNELGVTLTRQGKYPEALGQFRAACVAAPGSSLAFNNVGDAYLQVGSFSDAVTYFKKSFALKPNALAASNISSALLAQGRAKEALPFSLKAVDLDPSDDWNWMELADCYSSLPGHQKAAGGAYKAAANAVERRLQTDPTDGPGWMQLALYRVKLASHQDAFAIVKKAEALNAKDIESQICKVRILEILGRRDDAIAALKICFRNGATDPQVSSIADLRALQRDPRYQELVRAQSLQ